MEQYQSLSDCSFFEPGDKIEIWYSKPECLGPALLLGTLKANNNNLQETHILVGKFGSVKNAENLLSAGEVCSDSLNEEIYYLMQGDKWDSKGEAYNLIKSLGLRHTSMSVGDIIKYNDGQYSHVFMVESSMVESSGFKKI